GQLIVRQGAADQELQKLARESGATAIYFNRDPDPFGRSMEAAIGSMAVAGGISIHSFKDIALHEREEVLTGTGQPYRVFTPYSRAWRLREKLQPSGTVSRISTPPDIPSLPLPTLATWELTSDAEIIAPGEAAARQRLDHLLEKIAGNYAEERNFPAAGSTSRISQDLRHGLLSIREVYQRLIEAAERGTAVQRRSFETFLNELIWREFYMQVLWFRPDVLEREYQPETRGLVWREPGEEYEAWKAGQTGFPIIDAGMRQLRSTGFLHNRVRMIVAMFLTKDLHISWKAGEQWFHQRLVDAEIASNNGGWQWSASTGTDAAPYFRIQNPWTQAKRFDPDGEYIRRWVPELRDVRTAHLFAPPPAGECITPRYPPPIVDHARERDVALEMFRR
ncbi:MAG TPA: deoxyribodipyrimidine photo-lyase, partial [Chthoniobacteraceae bacterium]